jgi:hypothetical protein
MTGGLSINIFSHKKILPKQMSKCNKQRIPRSQTGEQAMLIGESADMCLASQGSEGWFGVFFSLSGADGQVKRCALEIA